VISPISVSEKLNQLETMSEKIMENISKNLKNSKTYNFEMPSQSNRKKK